MTGGNLKSLCWLVAIIYLTCAGPYSPAAVGENLSPPKEENFDEIIPSTDQAMRQEGFRPVVRTDRELYSLVSKIARSNGATLSDYDEVVFYESADQYRVELVVDIMRRIRSVPIELPPSLYLWVSKSNMTVTEIQECSGMC